MSKMLNSGCAILVAVGAASHSSHFLLGKWQPTVYKWMTFDRHMIFTGFSVCRCQPSEIFLPLYAISLLQTEPGICTSSQPGLCSLVSAKSQPQTLQLAPNGVRALAGLTSSTGLDWGKCACGETLQQQEYMPIARVWQPLMGLDIALPLPLACATGLTYS